MSHIKIKVFELNSDAVFSTYPTSTTSTQPTPYSNTLFPHSNPTPQIPLTLRRSSRLQNRHQHSPPSVFTSSTSGHQHSPPSVFTSSTSGHKHSPPSVFTSSTSGHQHSPLQSSLVQLVDISIAPPPPFSIHQFTLAQPPVQYSLVQLVDISIAPFSLHQFNQWTLAQPPFSLHQFN